MYCLCSEFRPCLKNLLYKTNFEFIFMTRIYMAILAFLFPAFLSAQTKTFAGTDYSQGIVFVMENNQIVWQHKAPDSNDLWVLPNGNILFTTGHGVLEMTRQNDTIFHYELMEGGAK